MTKLGLTVFARIDHAAGATKVDMALRPTELLIFGDPKGGTPLMQDRQIAEYRPAGQGAGLGGRDRQGLADPTTKANGSPPGTGSAAASRAAVEALGEPGLPR